MGLAMGVRVGSALVWAAASASVSGPPATAHSELPWAVLDQQARDAVISNFVRLGGSLGQEGGAPREPKRLAIRDDDPWNLIGVDRVPQKITESFFHIFDAVLVLSNEAAAAWSSICGTGELHHSQERAGAIVVAYDAALRKFNETYDRVIEKVESFADLPVRIHALSQATLSVLGDILRDPTPFGVSFREYATRLRAKLGLVRPPPLGGADKNAVSCLALAARMDNRFLQLARTAHTGITQLYYLAVVQMIPASTHSVPRMRFHHDMGLTRGTILAHLLRAISRQTLPAPLPSPEKPAAGLRMVEVGVGLAGIAEALLDGFPSLRYVGVDPWLGKISAKSPEEGETRYAKALLRLMRFSSRATIFRTTSQEAAEWIQDNSLDLIFVDGLHTYEACLFDLQTWIPKLRSGGVVAGHDYSTVFHGIPVAVNDAFAQHPAADGELHLTPDNLFFWRLP